MNHPLTLFNHSAARLWIRVLMSKTLLWSFSFQFTLYWSTGLELLREKMAFIPNLSKRPQTYAPLPWSKHQHLTEWGPSSEHTATGIACKLVHVVNHTFITTVSHMGPCRLQNSTSLRSNCTFHNAARHIWYPSLLPPTHRYGLQITEQSSACLFKGPSVTNEVYCQAQDNRTAPSIWNQRTPEAILKWVNQLNPGRTWGETLRFAPWPVARPQITPWVDLLRRTALLTTVCNLSLIHS